MDTRLVLAVAVVALVLAAITITGLQKTLGGSGEKSTHAPTVMINSTTESGVASHASIPRVNRVNENISASSEAITTSQASLLSCIKRLRVAVYNGSGTWFSGLEALRLYFRSRGISYEMIGPSGIKAGGLGRYDVLVMPGGWAYSYWLRLGPEGNKAIKAFVKKGGGYLGICAGGFYAAKAIIWEAGIYHYSLKIVNAVAEGPKKGYPWPTRAYIPIRVSDKLTRYGLNRTYTALYYGGPEFVYIDNQSVVILATYVDDGRAAIIAAQYGSGRVVLTGVHLEVSEETWPLLDILLAYLGHCIDLGE